MTELTLDKEQPDVDVTALIKAVKILLMVIPSSVNQTLITV